MKRSFLITLLGVLVAGFTFAQSEETRSLSSFSRISANEGIDVFIKKGDKEEARIVSRNIDLEDVLTDVSGSRLKIHLYGDNHRNVDVEVYVTYRSINAISVSSAASLRAEGQVETNGDFDVDVSSAGSLEASIKAEELSLDVSSAGDAELTINVDEIEADVSSSGDIEVEGTARMVDVEAASAGEYDGYDVESEEADVSASSGGTIKISVSEKVDARASSGGTVRYKGSPRYVDVSSSSGGSIRKY